MSTTRDAVPPAPVSATARLTRVARRPGIAPAIGVAAIAVAHAALLLAAFSGSGEDVVLRGFIHQSYQDSGRVLDGAMPYRDFLLEYPPGTLLFMLIPRLAAAGYLHYRSLFFLEVAALDGLIVAAQSTRAGVGSTRRRRSHESVSTPAAAAAAGRPMGTRAAGVIRGW